ncbi:alkaline phosphatase family protein [Haliovirga abyssi]|uniref:PglZ domain-containing protein n=1 Tax=Haliovirga abyssi TaxID=2996794 RepID=A0AAU9DSJ7_9FUSO|nr:alkaline phosphatase family protein [Haliovirga abyssi]BDU50004.1 hypothetical protein HLVA_05730 [Haliovirga abyssi]
MRDDFNANIAGYRRKGKKIFIQIDALPYEMLLRAIDRGYTPFLKKLINKKGYTVNKIFSELPSNTPAAEMKIMYGIKNWIKGFRWYNKKEKRHYNFKNPLTANYFEEKAEKFTEKPILKNGASYITFYSAGAKRTILTFSRGLKIDVNKSITNNKIWQFILINTDFLIKVTIDVVEELLKEGLKFIKYILIKKRKIRGLLFPYVRIVNNVLFRHIATMGSILEMNEGVERIYLVYNGYDEVAHQLGADATESLKTLKKIDKSIMNIYKTATKKGYELYIFSDHGQTNSIPFEEYYGILLTNYIKQEISKDIGISEYSSDNENRKELHLYFLDKIFKTVSELNHKIINKIIKKFLKKTNENIKNENEIIENDIIVTNSGPLSHIYFLEEENRMLKDEIIEYFPEIIDKIFLHNGIEFGVVKTKYGFEIKGRKGKIELNNEFEIVNETGNLFKNILRNIKKETIISSLKEISCGENVGDLIIFGALLKNNLIINFENQYGGHGGIGGMQNFPFLIANKELEKDKKSISNLYEIFK